jgi:hypothetical protein
VTLKPRESSPQVFIANQPHDGVFTVRLNAHDDLPVDNVASVVSLLPKPVKVLLVTAGNRFLEKALRAAPKVELSIQAQLTDPAANYDLVVLDNVMPIVWPKPNTLAIRVAKTNWFEGMSRIEGPPIVDWKTGHPLLRFVNFDNVQVAEAAAVKTPSWAISLVDSPTTSLLMAGQLQSQRIVWIGFDTLQSTWPLRISFPIFIANAVDWLNPAFEKAAQLSVKVGSPFRLLLPESVKSAEIKLPDGSTEKKEIDPGKRELLFGDTMKQGVYQVSAGTNQVTFCANLLDAPETDVTPHPEIQFGKYAKVGNSNLRQANLEVWRWFALTALIVLLVEWWYYHRRTV